MHRLNHPVYRNRTLQVVADAFLVALAFFLAFRLRFLDDAGGLPDRYETLLWSSIGIVAAGKVAVFAAFGMYTKWWRYVSGGDFLNILRAVAVSSAILVVVFTVAQPFAYDLPRRTHPEGPGGPGRRRRLGWTDGCQGASAEPEPGQDGHRLHRRRRAQAGHEDARAEGAGLDRRDRDDPRRDRAGRSGDRDPLRPRDSAGQGRRGLPCPADPGPHAADRLRAAARRGPAQQAAARRPGRGRARPRPGRRRARSGRRLPRGPHRPRHRRRRLGRRRALPPDRPGGPPSAGDARQRRDEPLPDRP